MNKSSERVEQEAQSGVEKVRRIQDGIKAGKRLTGRIEQWGMIVYLDNERIELTHREIEFAFMRLIRGGRI